MPNTTPRGKVPAIEDRLRAEIAKADHGPEERIRLGSETELAKRFEVARNTLRAALTRLASDGLIYSEPARGWYIGSKAEAPATPLLNEVLSTLRDRIAPLAPEVKFTTAPRVAEEFALSLPMARQVLTILGSEGLIESKHGKGWFVSTRD